MNQDPWRAALCVVRAERQGARLLIPLDSDAHRPKATMSWPSLLRPSHGRSLNSPLAFGVTGSDQPLPVSRKATTSRFDQLSLHSSVVLCAPRPPTVELGEGAVR
jgi:hypothetical protein